MSLTDGKVPTLSWKGLIHDGLKYIAKKGLISEGQQSVYSAHVEADDLDEVLGAAEFMGRKLGAPLGDLYERWFRDAVGGVRPTNVAMASAVQSLSAAGIPLCTLNYDHLLERVTELPTITLNDTRTAAEYIRRERPGILHLHGSFEKPATCVLGIREYEATLHDDVRDLIQRHLAGFEQLLFIGCGGTFSDPNFSALIAWLRRKLGAGTRTHYALVADGEVARYASDKAWHGFVEPLGYGASHSALPGFLEEQFKPLMRETNAGVPKALVDVHSDLLRRYSEYILRDCGQMTIEGVRADSETSQRKFDLEKLFVPLRVEYCGPKEKEGKWLEHVGGDDRRVSFGKVFETFRRIALLGIPGAGKTLLLKRLAVAYAQPKRRPLTPDELPDLPLFPVMIRCREWRGHVHQPILTLLENLPAITGRAELKGTREALTPLFESGQALLLVDGLDEIHSDAERATFVENLDSFLREYSKVPVVVTSREAGFGLVAPKIAGICTQLRIAPLAQSAVQLLCVNWHQLMTGDSPESQKEGRDIAIEMLSRPSLVRLAENPLLLTMLLVVKHGNGRLPPDRVTLYSRAVEVLLDTWNIKGHEPLLQSEAVPQLAFVAFYMQKRGTQTVTEEELLKLIADAREKVPRLRYYAKGTPYEFLKRVELRSSLLVETGFRATAHGVKPFYQFRHLTFQEYLAAVSVVEGHYAGNKPSDTLLAPIGKNLLAPAWKEIIPMAAVLAKKAAEPLFLALVQRATEERDKIEPHEGSGVARLDISPASSRLIACLAEEAEASVPVLTEAIQICIRTVGVDAVGSDWKTLVRGPFGAQISHELLSAYRGMRWSSWSWLYGVCAVTASARWSSRAVFTEEGRRSLAEAIAGSNQTSQLNAMFACAGAAWDYDYPRSSDSGKAAIDVVLPLLEPHIYSGEPVIWAAAAFAYGTVRTLAPIDSPVSPDLLDRLVSLWLSNPVSCTAPMVKTCLRDLAIPRASWKPKLTSAHRALLSERLNAPSSRFLVEEAELTLAFYAGDLISKQELRVGLRRWMNLYPARARSVPASLLEQLKGGAL